MPVALNNLGRDRVKLQPQLSTNGFLHLRVEMSKSADGARNLADLDLLGGLLQTAQVATGFVVPNGDLQPQSCRLCMDAVRAANHHGLFVLVGSSLQSFQKTIQAG